MLRTLCFLTLLAACAMLPAAGLQAGKFNSAVSIGDRAAEFNGIVGVDDKQYSLADYQDAKAVVVVFTCNHCPVAVAYEERLVALQQDYRARGVQVIAINVNNGVADRLDKMKERAASRGFNFPYLYDSSQESARNYGAAVTPHVFLLDGDRKIAYMGAVDDSQNSAKVSKHYLRDAIEAVLAGKQPEVTETRQFGCSVKYDN